MDKAVSTAPAVPLYIGGKNVQSHSKEWRDIVNPATQEVVARVPMATRAEVEQAVANAKETYASWRQTPLGTRMRIMLKFQQLLRENVGRIAELVTREHGKTLPDAEGEVMRGLEVVEHACAITSLQLGEVAENAAGGVDVYTLHQPLGVGAGITAFNFPIMLPCFMFPIAVSCGNTFVLKPSEQDPSSTMLLVELAHQAGLPPGVLNVVHGGAEVVDMLCDHPDIKAVSFIGSTQVGTHVYRRASEAGKRAQCMMGAKNHCVILPDASKSHAINNLLGSAFGAAGQRCMANSMVILVGKARDWLPEIVERARALKVNAGSDREADLGPLVSKNAKARVERLIDSGVRARRQAAAGRPQLRGQGCTARQFRRPDDLHRRHRRNGYLRAGSIRPGAGRGRGGHAGPGDRRDQCQSERQRHFDLHLVRLGRAQVPERDRRRPGRHQRPGAGAGRLLQLHRLACVQARRPRPQRQAGGAVLDPDQDRHRALVRAGIRGRRHQHHHRAEMIGMHPFTYGES